MKLNLKKVLMGVAIGFAASLTISSNLNVLALTKAEKAQDIAAAPDLVQKQEVETANDKEQSNNVAAGGCPTIIDENGKPQTDRLVILTCVEKDPKNKPEEYTYVFDIPMATSEVVKNFKSGKLVVKAKNDNEIVAEKVVDLKNLDLNNENDVVFFEMSAENLPDSDDYVFEVYDGDKFKGKFEHVKINLKENIPSAEENRRSLEFFDKSVIKTVDGEKTADHAEYSYSKNCDEFKIVLYPNGDEMAALTRKVEGKQRESVLEGHNKISLIYKDKNTGEQKLEKELPLTEKEFTVDIGPNKGNKIKDISFSCGIKNSEIEFGKTYNVEVFDENKQLLGTLEHSIGHSKAQN